MSRTWLFSPSALALFTPPSLKVCGLDAITRFADGLGDFDDGVPGTSGSLLSTTGPVAVRTWRDPGLGQSSLERFLSC
jgi:hypothetical protein